MKGKAHSTDEIIRILRQADGPGMTYLIWSMAGETIS